MTEMPEPGLAVAERTLSLVAGHSPFPVELLDHEGRVLYGNQAYSDVFLGGRRVAPGRPSSVLPEVMPDGRFRADWLTSLQDEGVWKGDLLLPSPAGSGTWFRVIVFALGRNDVPGGELAIFYENIQTEVDSREALTRQQDLVAILSRQAQMGELLSMIAHQWRQPLTVVMSLIGNIQMKASLGTMDPGYLAAKLDRIAKTVTFLSETIDSFRNFYVPAKSKSEEDLVGLAQRALELVGPSLQGLGTQVDFRGPEDPVKVLVFSGELIQVAVELITNARDALATGAPDSPVLRIRVFRDGDHGVLEVENNGGEIPSDVLPYIYDPYYTTKEGVSGTGLGLYMSKLIVENHHGGVVSASSQGGWTSFTCSLPIEVRG